VKKSLYISDLICLCILVVCCLMLLLTVVYAAPMPVFERPAPRENPGAILFCKDAKHATKSECKKINARRKAPRKGK
jgi:hypothetical protein